MSYGRTHESKASPQNALQDTTSKILMKNYQWLLSLTERAAVNAANAKTKGGAAAHRNIVICSAGGASQPVKKQRTEVELLGQSLLKHINFEV